MAYPCSSMSPPLATADRYSQSTYQDLHFYSTYPRRPSANISLSDSGVNGNLIFTSAGDSAKTQIFQNGGNSHSLRGILRNKYDYAPVSTAVTLFPDRVTVDDPLDYGNSCHDNHGSDSEFPTGLLQKEKPKGCLAKANLHLEKLLRPAISELFAVIFASFTITFIESSIWSVTMNRLLLNCIVAAIEGCLYAISALTYHNVSRWLIIRPLVF